MIELSIFKTIKLINSPEWVDNAMDYLDDISSGSCPMVIISSHYNGKTPNVIYELSNGVVEYYVYYTIGHWNKAVINYVYWLIKTNFIEFNSLFLNLADYIYYDKKGIIRFNFKKFKKDIPKNDLIREDLFRELSVMKMETDDVILTEDGCIISEVFYQDH